MRRAVHVQRRPRAAKLKQDPNFPVKHVMGTGPFKFVEHVAGSHWVGKRSAEYFQKGKPYLDGFRAATTSAIASQNRGLSRQRNISKGAAAIDAAAPQFS